jgi:hypothetical protein
MWISLIFWELTSPHFAAVSLRDWLGWDTCISAAAVFSIAQCAHVGGSLKIAGELYERAIAIIRNAKEGSKVNLTSFAMAPDEVHIGALADLGQLAAHKGYEFSLSALFI